MIRRVLVPAMRRQDWAAVAIEVLVVIVGLYLGLQLNGWKESRDARGREQVALARLQDESEEIVRYFRQQVDQSERDIEGQEAALLALSAGERARFTAAELGERIGTLDRYPGIAPPRAVYDELTGSGLMSDVGSTAVRTDIASYYARLAYVQSQLDYFRLFRVMLQSQELPGATSTFDPAHPRDIERFVYSADFDAIVADPRAMQQLIDGFRSQLVFLRYRTSVLERAEAMCTSLAQTLGKRCESARAEAH